ncbi:hypothetical protein ARMSODRAFT_634017 [Armillaria solidipes]|uniref:Uncharacterized protein n=1 Tax=Armillaria solidipes TaxID=1076256 RepID=A0A2H3C9H8_9AGAR|nr:hypothetical protein ARMSODRAFT_634017 [Armillaria solidipes]
MVDGLVVPAPPQAAPRIKKMYVDVETYDMDISWEGLRLYRDVYLDNLEELHVVNPPPDDLWSVAQTANLASKDLRVLEIDCQRYAYLGPNTTPLDLNNIADLRFGVELSDDDDMLLFINWWIHSFKTVEKDSPIIEQVTIRLADAIGPEQLEPLKRAFEELSDFLSKLVRNVDLVFQLQKYEAQPSPLASRFRNAIVDACEVLKEKSNLRVFDMDEYIYQVPVSPISS